MCTENEVSSTIGTKILKSSVRDIGFLDPLKTIKMESFKI